MAPRLRIGGRLAISFWQELVFQPDLCYQTAMKNCCTPNLDAKGRLARTGLGTVLVIGGLLLSLAGWRCCGVLIILVGGFAWFEALRGWCVMRACGFKTKQ
jgi:hypothetical protein